MSYSLYSLHIHFPAGVGIEGTEGSANGWLFGLASESYGNEHLPPQWIMSTMTCQCGA